MGTPTYLYRLGDDGEVEARIFDLDDGEEFPSEWVDTPAKITEAPETAEPEVVTEDPEPETEPAEDGEAEDGD